MAMPPIHPLTLMQHAQREKECVAIFENLFTTEVNALYTYQCGGPSNLQTGAV